MKKTGGEIIIDALIGQGVEYIFGIPGHGCFGIFDALRERESRGLIKYIQVKQEMCGVFMADGFYRACGKPLAVLASIGAGAVNTILGTATAYVDSTPVMVITGDAHTHMRGTGILQEFDRQADSDLISCMRPVSKRCWRAENVSQLQRIVKRSFGAMLTGRRGPVVLSVPMDVQCDWAEIPDRPPEKFEPFAGPAAKEQQVREAAELIKKAERPVLLLGGGAYYARCPELLTQLAEKIGAPVITTMAAKGAFPENHPLYAFHGGSKGTEAGNHIARSADLVIALGCRFADETASSYKYGATYKFPDTKLIHVDIDAGEIGKNYPATLGIIADLGIFAKQLSDYLGSFCRSLEKNPYFAELTAVKTAWLDKIKKNAEADHGGITISRLLLEMRASLAPDTIITASSGNTQAQLLQEYIFEKPGCFVTTGGFSTMGFAVPAAMGVSLAAPDKKIVSLCGDGDFMMSMQELSTAAQYNIPIVMIVANNMGWLAIKDLQIDVLGENHAYGNDFTTPDKKLYSPDFKSIAEGFGIEAQRVSAPDEIKPTLQKAIKAKSPQFIEVIVNREYPYSGGGATGWWDVPVPGYIRERREKYEEEIKGEYLL